MERIDDLQLKGLRLIQNTDYFCFGTDAVLLADFARLKKNARVADFGTGNGILPLLLWGRREDVRVLGLELQPELCGLARRSVELNGLSQQIRIICGNIREARNLLEGEFDTVVCNPPFEKADAGVNSENRSQRIARFEVEITFPEICASARQVLKSGGRLTMIHRASRLAELFDVLKQNGFAPKELRFVHSFVTEPPARVLLSAVRDGADGLSVLPPLIVHREDGSETDEVRRIYHRDGL